ncbi:molybdopterin-guanine dinucleotide biosynthesis protein A, proteobacterial [SAR116 cluster alpha proteobacterium HIMB100]|nr:molybdopterin-guanine dinucleotide biosynthesis protein A, proteobacterial [SAR116 cluster alpha proteobacterium HIMB100]
MISAVDIAVGFLAGGQARRMGGQDKPFISVGGQTILDRQLAVTAQHSVRLINANGDLSRFSGYGLPVVADNIADWPGPLAGILACLDWLAETHPKCDLMLSCATDAPFIPSDLAARLLAERNAQGAVLAQARSSGRRHPVFGLWPVALRAELRSALLDDGIRKIDDFSNRFSVAIVEFSGEPDPFSNVNRPEDVTAAQAAFDR